MRDEKNNNVICLLKIMASYVPLNSESGQNEREREREREEKRERWGLRARGTQKKVQYWVQERERRGDFARETELEGWR